MNEHHCSHSQELTFTSQVTVPFGGHIRTFQDTNVTPDALRRLRPPLPLTPPSWVLAEAGAGRAVKPGQDPPAQRSCDSQAPRCFSPVGQTAWGPSPGSPTVRVDPTPDAEGRQMVRHPCFHCGLLALCSPHSSSGHLTPKHPEFVTPPRASACDSSPSTPILEGPP